MRDLQEKVCDDWREQKTSMQRRLKMSNNTFLTNDEVCTLTGCKLKKLQAEVLRKNGLPFTLNHQGRPIVTRTAIDGAAKKQTTEPKQAWSPPILRLKAS